jgi:signal transduction histidine kinase
MLTLFTAFVIFALLANVLVGGIVFVTNPRRSANRVFAVLSLFIAAWLTCQALGSSATTEAGLGFWIRQACASSAFLPLIFYMLRNAVLHPDWPTRVVLRRPPLWAAAAVVVAGLCQAPGFLRGARLAVSPTALGEPVYGPLFGVFAAYWGAAVMALIWSFVRVPSSLQGVRRLELRFMALGSILGLLPGVVLVLLIPILTGSSQAVRYSPFAVVIWHATIAYGIATRRIMGVAEFLQRGTAYVVLAGGLVPLYFLVFASFRFVLRNVESGDVLAHLLATLIVASCLAPANTRLQRGARRLFAADRDQVAELLQEGSHLTRSITTIDALLVGFGRLVQQTLGVETVRIYIRSGNRFELRHRDDGPSLAAAGFADDDPLVCALRDAGRTLVRDVMRRAGGEHTQVHAERRLARVDAEAAVGLRSKGELDGFILLGRRLDGRVFAAREVDVLDVLGDQLGIAIENALLYTRLQDAKVYNDMLLDNLVTGVVAADAGGRITVCNREARRILGLLAPAAAPGCLAAEVLPEPLAEALQQCLTAAVGVRDSPTLLRPRTPVELPIRYGTAVLTGSADRPLGGLLVLQDVSALRRLEEQVRRSDRLASLGTLAAGMAHEIKNPLVSLKTFVQLLPERYDDPEFRTIFTPLLGTEVSRIDAVVTQLLGFARPVKTKLVLTPVHAAIEASLRLVAQQIKSKNLELVQRCQAAADEVLGDEHLLSQVFVNLLLNGIDATPAGGTLTVVTRLTERPLSAWRAGQEASAWIEVQVRDTGPGITAEDRPRVFDPFFTTKPNGTGLGLSVTYGIVCDHQGCIDVESEPGQGACFRVSLPLLPRSDS